MAEKKRAHTLLEAKFNPQIKTYIYVGGILFCIITIAGIILLPFWLFLGRIYINRYFDSLYCELTTRALHFKKGVWFQTERTVPLDKIQDLTFREGPVLRYWGLSTLKVETAGQSAQGMADMSLTGIIDARNFRERVLEQRDETTNRENHTGIDSPAANGNEELITLLSSMHKTLQSIENKIDR
ncbi:MAG: PH domain-containing protein [Balneolaceae bacterium]